MNDRRILQPFHCIVSIVVLLPDTTEARAIRVELKLLPNYQNLKE